MDDVTTTKLITVHLGEYIYIVIDSYSKLRGYTKNRPCISIEQAVFFLDKRAKHLSNYCVDV